ncbi:hypothetical protein JXA47_07880 [Candidatus Sumerlaeota bacterium]|nr:hypothetical protein [Candidatus Sumerlaeota bacterium]
MARPAALALLIAPLALAATAQLDDESLQSALSEAVREGVQVLVNDPELESFRTLAVIPFGGELGQRGAEILAEALSEAGRGVTPAGRVRDACRDLNIELPLQETPRGGASTDLIAALGADALVLIEAQVVPGGGGGNAIAVEIELSDPIDFVGGWGVDVTVEIREPRARGGSYWQRHPGHVIGAIALLIVIWAISALRRRAAS